jgi:hypothetical protein
VSQDDSASTTGSHSKTDAAKDGVGVPDDAVTSFAKAIADAGKAALKDDAGDPNVSVAFQLGWTIEVIAHSPGDDTVKTLPGLDGYPDATFPKILGQRLSGALAKLKDVVVKAGLEIAPSVAKLAGTLTTGATPSGPDAVQSIHGDVVAMLIGTDRKLARAYGLGRALRRLTSPPVAPEDFADATIAPIINGLDDLSSAFPPHAGRSVGLSMQRWQTTLKASPGELPDPEELKRQGELWRSLLGADKVGRDMLEPENYLDAATNLARRYSRIVWRALRPFLPWVVLALVLFVGGVVLIVADDKTGTVVAGIGGILASLGLTWKGAGGALGDLAGKLERPLWGAELDVAIADAITMIGTPPGLSTDRGAANGDYGGRRARAHE